MKICKDCRFYGPRRDGPLPGLMDVCLNRKAATRAVDLVTGAKTTINPFASDQRRYGWIGARMMHACGKEGRWWKANVYL